MTSTVGVDYRGFSARSDLKLADCDVHNPIPGRRRCRVSGEANFFALLFDASQKLHLMLEDSNMALLSETTLCNELAQPV